MGTNPCEHSLGPNPYGNRRALDSRHFPPKAQSYAITRDASTGSESLQSFGEEELTLPARLDRLHFHGAGVGVE
jgi:hypothetical protein